MPAPPSTAAKTDSKRSGSTVQTSRQQHNREKASGNLASPDRNRPGHGAGRQDGSDERVTRIYPRELAKSPSSAARNVHPTSPTLKPYGPLSSPLLSTFGPTANTAAYYTSEWTKSLPFVSKQAGPNEVGINGSPPNMIPSRTPRSNELYHSAPSNSPPGPTGRPLSQPNQYSSFGERLHPSPLGSPRRDRRTSMLSNTSQRPSLGVRAPLPHEPQAHFYGAPTLDFGVLNALGAGLRPGENGYFCGFDTLSNAGDERSQCAENVLLIGREGGLEVFWVERDKMDLIGRLEGLNGSVIGAKILPWTARDDPCFSKRPLVALTIHGPVLPEAKSGSNSSSSSSIVGTEEQEGSSESPTRPLSREVNELYSGITDYRTAVEVYSLKEKLHVATLYTSPSVAVQSPVSNPMSSRPPPVGGLRVDASGRFVTVASGCSGEVFIFALSSGINETESAGFSCIGKVWTFIHFRSPGPTSNASSTTDVSNQYGESGLELGVPLCSLSHRWLAVVAPVSSSVLSLNGTAAILGSDFRPPGINTHTAPPQPMVTCGVDLPEADSRLNDVAREVTQGVIKGARWVSDQGVQAFKNYWGKTSLPVGQSANGDFGSDAQPQPYFPPTHGHTVPTPQASSEPTLVSIIDLQRLFDAQETKNKIALEPFATFAVPLGCKYVSFAPSGLSLLTVSRKGDVQYVWDLMRVHSGRLGQSASDAANGPRVRQIARITRMTEANIVDVVWSEPKGDRLAILTEKGTIHIHELPGSAFQWPPLRRKHKPAQPVRPQDSDDATNETSSKSWMSAVSSGVQAVNGRIAAARSRSASQGSRFPVPTLSSLGMAPAAGAKGGKTVAAGLKHGLGAATDSVNHVWHARDNKLDVHSLATGVLPGRMRWLTGKARGAIAVVAGGVVHVYPVKRSPTAGPGKKSGPSITVAKDKSIGFDLPAIPAPALPPALHTLAVAKRPAAAAPAVTGEWKLRGPPAAAAPAPAPAVAGTAGPSRAHPLSCAEIETTAPYQPFHTDRRVGLFALAGAVGRAARPGGELEPWVFGKAVPATRIVVGAEAELAGEDEGSAEAEAEAEAEGNVESGAWMVEGEAEGEEVVERIVVTARRRRGGRGGAGAGRAGEEDGFFEDDCDVLDFAGDRV